MYMIPANVNAAPDFIINYEYLMFEQTKNHIVAVYLITELEKWFGWTL